MFFVKTLLNRTLVIEKIFGENDIILNLKEEIRSTYPEYENNELKLIFRGQELNDNTLILPLKIEQYNCIHLIIL